MVLLSARRILRSRQRDAWDALADIEVFIFATEAELAAMEAERVGVHRHKPDPDLQRRVLGLIWMLTFGGMPWRIAGFLSGIPFTTLHRAFARWTRLGLAMLPRLAELSFQGDLLGDSGYKGMP